MLPRPVLGGLHAARPQLVASSDMPCFPQAPMLLRHSRFHGGVSLRHEPLSAKGSLHNALLLCQLGLRAAGSSALKYFSSQTHVLEYSIVTVASHLTHLKQFPVPLFTFRFIFSLHNNTVQFLNWQSSIFRRQRIILYWQSITLRRYVVLLYIYI